MGDHDARVRKYIDSPLMSNRRVQGDYLTASIDGSLGTYSVRVSLDGKRASCSCPVGGYCKHAEAVYATFRRRPESFAGYKPVSAQKPKAAKPLVLVRHAATWEQRKPW